MLSKVGILCTYRFPEGMAPTVRIRAYGQGLVRNGIVVEVVIFQPKSIIDNYPTDSFVDGIHYIYSHVRKPDASRFHKLFIDNPRAIINTFRIIFSSHRKHHYDVLLLSFDQIKYLQIFVPILWIMGIKMAFIGDEFPSPIRQLKTEVPKIDIIKYKLFYRFIDARILMTDALRQFYDRSICFKPTYILCSVLDTNRFKSIKRQVVDRPYLCYMGNMMLSKDNVDNIVESFALLSQEYPNLELHLYGTPNNEDRRIVEDCIARHHLTNRVFIKGRIDYDQVPQVLSNATILVTSQPMTKRAEGGFPTKLAEYLMSHTPAVVTRVGEIDHYVKDRDTVYFVDPCNPVQYANTLRYILSHPHEASCVAERAYAFACANYGAEEVTLGLIAFLNKYFC